MRSLKNKADVAQRKRITEGQLSTDFLDHTLEWRRIFAETWGTFLLVVVAELRQHANDRSKLLITGNYYSTVTGEHDKAARTFHEMIETYPRSATAYFSLGEEYAALGQYETAAEMTAKAQELGPGEVPAYSNLTGYQLALQRFGQDRATIDRAKASFQDADSYYPTLAHYRNLVATQPVDYAVGAERQSLELKKGCPPRAALGPNQFGSKLVARVLIAFW